MNLLQVNVNTKLSYYEKCIYIHQVNFATTTDYLLAADIN